MQLGGGLDLKHYLIMLYYSSNGENGCHLLHNRGRRDEVKLVLVLEVTSFAKSKKKRGEMKYVNSCLRNLLIPSMMFLGACCSQKDLAVAPESVNPPPPPPPSKVVVPVLGDIFFDFDKSVLSMDATEQLKTNSGWLQANPKKTVVIEGHCDERGTNEYNFALGERRADSAKDYLIQLGADPSRLKAVSFGAEKPFAVGHTEEAWAQNRRAHFVAE